MMSSVIMRPPALIVAGGTIITSVVCYDGAIPLTCLMRGGGGKPQFGGIMRSLGGAVMVDADG